MQIESLNIKNYRCFRDIELNNLTRMTIVVGANGSGKSSLFDVFTFLKDALTQNVATAVARRGGYRELLSRGQTGPIEIVVKFRESGGRLATYRLIVNQESGRAVVEREVLSYRRGQYGKPWHFVDFSRGEGMAITNESVYGMEGVVEQRAEYKLDDPSILAIKGLGQFREFKVVSDFRSMIENWHISDFHIADARPSAEVGYAEHLSTRGDNVALVAQYLYENHPQQFNKVLMAMRQRVPGVSDVEAKPTEDGRLVLRFQDGSFQDPFIARYVSDGTIKMFAYLVLLYDPNPHPLLAVEEPENQLYPALMRELVEEFYDYAQRGGQVFVSTHSPDFLNGAELDEIRWLVKVDGFSSIRRASESELLQALVHEGDLPGALWRQGVFDLPGMLWRQDQPEGTRP
ncbi:MAG: AAA family ATPase [Caldilineaceae bacterium SB0670_bin_27]|uniref:AAA family ATPase n=1 Tax=Caldilineaceae bacterium SB0664_bin_27 TaxID=2605260 RepID=A0A6B0Z0G8_9CHLR|nr:AAA family ATPase [Caldilineaceae bacterium SB0664_bin_27]MYJ76889.1 AAA family ATPase [Caldilineaceae bacterium SB0670_bin_27]